MVSQSDPGSGKLNSADETLNHKHSRDDAAQKDGSRPCTTSLSKLSFMDLPNELIQHITDLVIVSSLQAPLWYDVSKDIGRPRHLKMVDWSRDYTYYSERIDPISGRPDYAAYCEVPSDEFTVGGTQYYRPKSLDDSWKLLWQDLGLASTNRFLRSIVWPRVDHILLEKCRLHLSERILVCQQILETTPVQGFIYIWRDSELRTLQRSLRDVTSVVPKWSQVKQQYISEESRVTRFALWKMAKDRGENDIIWAGLGCKDQLRICSVV